MAKPGTYSETGKVSQFWCSKCDEPKATFRERWYNGYHAGGAEDRAEYLCPTCGLWLEVEELPDEELKLTEELKLWFVNDAGISSLTIASVLVPELRSMCLARLHGIGFYTPADPSDFGRCYRLLKMIPNGVERLPEVASAHPGWQRFVEHWSELTALYEQDEKASKLRHWLREFNRLEPAASPAASESS